MTIGTKTMSFKTIIASAAVALGMMAGAAPGRVQLRGAVRDL